MQRWGQRKGPVVGAPRIGSTVQIKRTACPSAPVPDPRRVSAGRTGLRVGDDAKWHRPRPVSSLLPCFGPDLTPLFSRRLEAGGRVTYSRTLRDLKAWRTGGRGPSPSLLTGSPLGSTKMLAIVRAAENFFGGTR